MGKLDLYELNFLQVLQKTRTAHGSDPIWNQKFEFDEIGGDECLTIKCYNQESFSDDNIGSARVNLEGLVEGSVRDVWVPLEKVSSGELRLQIEAVRVEDHEGSRVCYEEIEMNRTYNSLDNIPKGKPIQCAQNIVGSKPKLSTCMFW